MRRPVKSKLPVEDQLGDVLRANVECCVFDGSGYGHINVYVVPIPKRLLREAIETIVKLRTELLQVSK